MRIMHISPVPAHPCFTYLIEEQKKTEDIYFVSLNISEEKKKYSIVKKERYIEIIGIKKNVFGNYDVDLEIIFAELLDEIKPDIVHIHVFSGFDLLPILSIASSKNIIKVLTLHDHSLFCLSGVCHSRKRACKINSIEECSCIYTEDFKKRLSLEENRLNLRRKEKAENIIGQTDMIICPSISQKETLKKLFNIEKKKITTLYYGTRLFNRKVPKKKKFPCFGYIGSLSWIKGVDMLLDAADMIKGVEFSLLFAVIFDRKDKQQSGLYKRIERLPNAKIKTDLKRAELPEFFSSIDYLIIPSVWEETGPMTLFESFFYETPVIISDMESMKEKVDVGKNALVFKDTEELAKIMHSLIEFPKIFSGFKVKDIKTYKKEIDSVYKKAEENHRPKELFLNLGYLCNNNCEYCVTGDNKPRNFIPLNEIIKVLKENRDKYNGVIFTGGEPTIRKDFLQIVEYAFIKGYNISVQTNGRMLSYPEFYKKLRRYNINFTININGSDAKIHDTISGVKGSFVQTIGAIDIIDKKNLLVKIIITKKNFKTILETSKMLVTLGVKKIWIVFPTPFGNSSRNFDLVVPSYNSIKKNITDNLDFLQKLDIKIGTEAIPYCMLEERHRKYATESSYKTNILDGFSPLQEKKEYNCRQWRIMQKQKPDTCQKCLCNKICEGIYIKYIEKYGKSEFKPII